MKLDEVFKTRTMARILADQGQIKKAKEIYTHLLEKNPHQEDLIAELEALENRNLSPKTDPAKALQKDLTPLYRQWIYTAFTYYRGHRS